MAISKLSESNPFSRNGEIRREYELCVEKTHEVHPPGRKYLVPVAIENYHIRLLPINLHDLSVLVCTNQSNSGQENINLPFLLPRGLETHQ
jgi:hypothetical protein